MNNPALSPRMISALQFIETLHRERRVAPTVANVADHLGVAKSAAHRVLNNLEFAGVIRRTGTQPRAIELIGTKITCPHCGHIAGSTPCIEAAARVTVARRTIPGARLSAKGISSERRGQ